MPQYVRKIIATYPEDYIRQIEAEYGEHEERERKGQHEAQRTGKKFFKIGVINDFHHASGHDDTADRRENGPCIDARRTV